MYVYVMYVYVVYVYVLSIHVKSSEFLIYSSSSFVMCELSELKVSVMFLSWANIDLLVFSSWWFILDHSLFLTEKKIKI